MKLTNSITTILMVVFAFGSIWLSIIYKNAREEIMRFKAVDSSTTELQEFSYVNRSLNEVLALNLTQPTVTTIKELEPLFKPRIINMIVYLKEYSCNSCNEAPLLRLLKRAGDSRNLLFAAHETNRDYFNNLASKNEAIDFENIKWLSGKLYDGMISNHDAELLFLDHQNRITGIIPLEYLKIEGLLNGVVERFLAVE